MSIAKSAEQMAEVPLSDTVPTAADAKPAQKPLVMQAPMQKMNLSWLDDYPWKRDGIKSLISRHPELIERLTIGFMRRREEVPAHERERIIIAGRAYLGKEFVHKMRTMHKILTEKPHTQEEAIEVMLGVFHPGNFYGFLKMVYGDASTQCLLAELVSCL